MSLDREVEKHDQIIVFYRKPADVCACFTSLSFNTAYYMRTLTRYS